MVVSEGRVYVLDRGREPHVVSVDAASGATIRRYVEHVPWAGDTIVPVGLGVRASRDSTHVLVLDRGKRLVHVVSAREREREAGLPRYHQLAQALPQSDNPTSIAAASWGVALGGTLTEGTRLALTTNLSDWRLLQDTARSRFGLPRNSFLRGISMAGVVALHPTERRALVASRFDRTVEAVDVDAGSVVRWALDGGVDAPVVSLRRARDSSVRLAWRPGTRLHFVSATASTHAAAFLDCDCLTRPPSANDMTRVWVVRWDGRPALRLIAPVKLSAIALAPDGTALLGTTEVGGWHRLVRWPLRGMLTQYDTGRGTRLTAGPSPSATSRTRSDSYREDGP